MFYYEPLESVDEIFFGIVKIVDYKTAAVEQAVAKTSAKTRGSDSITPGYCSV